MANTLKPGDQVVVEWGLDEVRGTIAEIYGHGTARRIVVELTPELSSFVVDERTTVTLPVDAVRRAGVTA
jgi:hypothetical protein